MKTDVAYSGSEQTYQLQGCDVSSRSLRLQMIANNHLTMQLSVSCAGEVILEKSFERIFNVVFKEK